MPGVKLGKDGLRKVNQGGASETGAHDGTHLGLRSFLARALRQTLLDGTFLPSSFFSPLALIMGEHRGAKRCRSRQRFPALSTGTSSGGQS